MEMTWLWVVEREREYNLPLKPAIEMATGFFWYMIGRAMSNQFLLIRHDFHIYPLNLPNFIHARHCTYESAQQPKKQDELGIAVS
jgi:hypothetical protein